MWVEKSKMQENLLIFNKLTVAENCPLNGNKAAFNLNEIIIMARELDSGYPEKTCLNIKGFTQALTVTEQNKGSVSQTLCWGQQEIGGLEQSRG